MLKRNRTGPECTASDTSFVRCRAAYISSPLYSLLPVTDTGEFRFDLFEGDTIGVLQNCKYITFPFKIPGVPEEINDLLTKCGETFFKKNLSPDDINECLICSKTILDVTWEKLNTGHWKNVDENLRYVYTFSSLFKVLCFLAKSNTTKQEVIKACDVGLLMGAPVMKNVLSKIAWHISSQILLERNDQVENKVKKIKLESHFKIKHKLKEVDKLELLDFYAYYVEKSEPVLLIDAIKHWPALSQRPWNLQYILDRTRFRTVPIELGSKYTDDNWTQKLMTIEEFICKYILNKSCQKEIGYLAQHNLFNQIPELLEDISIPEYITENKENVDISIYFGPSGTVSPLHYDPKRNLLAQVAGEKYIRLYSKEETKYLYPKYNSWLSNTSEVDVENPDLERYPLFSKATYYECILRPGSLLYIPPECWHFVKSLSTSISISFWW